MTNSGFLWLCFVFLMVSGTTAEGFSCRQPEKKQENDYIKTVVKTDSSVKSINAESAMDLAVAVDSSVESQSKKSYTKKNEVITPEMFGATGDGVIRKLSSKYSTLADAQKDYPAAQDLDFSIDGAAFQKAVDYAASKGGGEVIAVKNYAINFPIETKSNVIIDGKNEGIIFNDNSRPKTVLNNAFFVGDYHGVAFTGGKGGFISYKVSGSVKAGQDFVKLANGSDIGAFKIGQIVMLCSVAKMVTEKTNGTILPYQITVSKIINIDGKTLHFEYPVDEDIDTAEIDANGSLEPSAQIEFKAVENVTIRNFTIKARSWATRWFGYKCDIENLKLIGSDVLVAGNALVRSTIKNISGSFSYRCIEVKTGAYDLIIDGINAQYNKIDGSNAPASIISIGEYNRNITIKNFTIDAKDLNIANDPVVGIRSRKITIADGKIYCRGQQNVVLRLYSDNQKFACNDNKISGVEFYCGNQIKNFVFIGSPLQGQIVPSSNSITDCSFFGGSGKTTVLLNSGDGNTIKNCNFSMAKLVKKPLFINGNMEANQVQQ